MDEKNSKQPVFDDGLDVFGPDLTDEPDDMSNIDWDMIPQDQIPKRAEGIANRSRTRPQSKELGKVKYATKKKVKELGEEAEKVLDKSRTKSEQLVQDIINYVLEHYDLHRTVDHIPFIVPKEGPKLVRLVNSGDRVFKEMLSAICYEVLDITPGGDVLATVMSTITGIARTKAPVKLYMRVANYAGNIIVDLGDDTCDAVIITSDGWTIGPSPVFFQRTRLTKALPRPTQDQDNHWTRLDLLQKVLNIPEHSFSLFVGWLAASLFPDMPHPVLAITGGQGSGKSSTMEMIASLVDPTNAERRSKPRDEENFAVSSAGSWVVPYDNISGLAPWLQDALCRVVTGEGFVARARYSDIELNVLSFRRVVMMTGVDLGKVQGDLAERMLLLELDKIGADDRKTEEQTREFFAVHYANLIGGLYDLVADLLLVRKEGFLVGKLSRMADFHKVLYALDAVRGTKAAENFIAHSGALAINVVGESSIASVIAAFAVNHPNWTGTLSDFFLSVTPDWAKVYSKNWPASPRAFSGELRRLMPALEQLGIVITLRRTTYGQALSLVVTKNLEGIEQLALEGRRLPQVF